MSQRTLWDWKAKRVDVQEDPADRNTRGSLDLSDLSDRTATKAAAAQRLHRRLECQLGIVDLVITDNRRRMLTTRSSGERQQIRVHHMFLGCRPEIVSAIADLAMGEDESRGLIRGYIRENREEIQFRPPDRELEHEGECFDLSRLLERARSHLEEFEVDDIAITWGRDGRGSKSIRFGSFDFDQRLIRVHPALDREWVPSYFVEFIIYHELLHAVCPPEEGQASRRVHTEEFLELERQFPRYEDAVEWESNNLRRILERDEK